MAMRMATVPSPTETFLGSSVIVDVGSWGQVGGGSGDGAQQSAALVEIVLSRWSSSVAKCLDLCCYS